MLKRAKWVKANQAHEPISRVAADVIRERLELVWEYAPLAVAQWSEEPEFLHQMRVGTRRSAAALVTFAELLPHKKSRHMHKRLKRLRKASGEARDLDVLADRMRRELEAGNAELAAPLQKLQELRAAAQGPIVAAVNLLAERNFPQKIAALCERIRWRGETSEPTYACEARRLMSLETDHFLAAAKKDLSDNEALHALRIEGKQLRYTMEVLAGAFDGDFRQKLYAELRELQDKLGQINDHAAAEQRLRNWTTLTVGEAAAKFEALALEENRAATTARVEFLDWWSPKRRRHLARKLRQAVEVK